MEYTIAYKKTLSKTLRKIQCENIENALKLAEELTSLGYIITRISRNV